MQKDLVFTIPESIANLMMQLCNFHRKRPHDIIQMALLDYTRYLSSQPPETIPKYKQSPGIQLRCLIEKACINKGFASTRHFCDSVGMRYEDLMTFCILYRPHKQTLSAKWIPIFDMLWGEFSLEQLVWQVDYSVVERHKREAAEPKVKLRVKTCSYDINRLNKIKTLKKCSTNNAIKLALKYCWERL